MAHTVNDNGLIGDFIKYHIRIRHNNHAPQSIFAGHGSYAGICGQQPYDIMNTLAHARQTLRRGFSQAGKNFIKLSDSFACIKQLHKLYFAQIA